MSEELPPEPEREPASAGTPEPAAEPTPDAKPDPTPEPPGEKEAGRRTMIMIVAAAVVVLIAIGVGVYLVATSGEDDVAADPGTPTITGSPEPEPPASTPPPSEPPASPAPSKAPPPPDKNVAAVRTAAEQAADAINERDVDAMQQLSCDPSVGGSVEEFPPEATARLTENPQITGDKATAQIELSISGSEPTVVPLLMERRDGRWCVP